MRLRAGIVGPVDSPGATFRMRLLQIAGLVTTTAISLAVIGAGLTYFGIGLFATMRSTIVIARIAGNQLQIDSQYLRVADQMRGGEQRQIDLAVRFPDFRPSRDASAGAGRAAGAATQEIVITLTVPDDAVEPADRASKLYARFLEPDAWSHPGGLVMRRFEARSPYEREELYIAPPEGRTFFARCMRPAQPPDGLPESCISEFRQSGLDVRVRYNAELLSEWQQLTDGVRGLVRSLMRNG